MAFRTAILLLLVVVVSVTLAGETGRGGRGYYPAFQHSLSKWRNQRPWGRPTNSVTQPHTQTQTQGHSSSSLSGLSQCNNIRYKNKCYTPDVTAVNWHNGRNRCLVNSTTLARMESPNEVLFIASYLYEGSESNYWIDLNDINTEGVWKKSDDSGGYTDWWAPFEPNGQENENCGLMEISFDKTGRLHDDNCGKLNRYLCEKQAIGECEEAGFKQKCYWFSSEEKTWFDASAHCKSIEQRLARVSATDQVEFLARVMPDSSWIDLNCGEPGSEGGHTHSWTGKEMCSILRSGIDGTDGRVEQAECNQTRRFICEKKPHSNVQNAGDLPGSVYGSAGSVSTNSVGGGAMSGMAASHAVSGGPAVGSGGQANSVNPQMNGGMAGWRPNYGMGMRPNYGMGMGPNYGMGMGMHG